MAGAINALPAPGELTRSKLCQKNLTLAHGILLRTREKYPINLIQIENWL